ncbi:MAG: hypothetical protein JNM56_08955, partial [Planctomycetia bacterium]|nr:hypothetical protein [Planctomycetia bacterium]
YPDALLLDAALKALLDLAERRPDLFLGGSEDDRAARLRRRGLRQGWLLRCRYQGHPVPESPTSPGENSRVLPAEFPHIADEEIAEPARRNKRLFADQAATPRWTDTGRAVLQRSIADLATPAELQELGTALFLDRPLGVFKRPTEPDRTPLLSYVAFSRTVAEQRLQELRNLEALDEAAWQAARQRLAELSVPGLPLQLTPGPARPGVPSLRDAFQTAHDFVLLFTTARSSATFWKLFDVEELGRHLPLDWLTSGQPIVIVGGGAVAGLAPHALRIYDSAQRPRLECEIAGDQGYRESLEGETPVAGLLLTRTWEVDEAGAMRENNIESRKWRLLPR